MNVHVCIPPDLRRSFRVNRRLRRVRFSVTRGLGAVFLLLGLVLFFANPGTAPVILVVFGLVVSVELDLILWLQLWRYRKTFARPVEVVVSDQGISQRTEIASLEVGWDLVKRVVEAKDFWVFVVNRFQMVVLWKPFLTPEQIAELSAFLAARPAASRPRSLQG